MNLQIIIPSHAMEKVVVPREIALQNSSANCSLYKLKSYGDWIYADGLYLLIKNYIDEDYSWYAIVDSDYNEIFGWQQDD